MNSRIASVRGRACRLVVASASLLVAVACTKGSPASPSSSAATAAVMADAALTASVAAPRPLTPANNAVVANAAQPVTLIVSNALVTKPGGATYTFEVATDSAFVSKVQSKDGVAEGTSGLTGVKLDALAAAKDYYWHARATGGGTTGVFGTVYKFTIGPAISINAPVPIAPLTGDQTTSRPALRVTNATRQGPVGAITYRFEISTTSTFASTIAAGTTAEGVNETGFTPTTDLPSTGTLFWRATAIDATSGTTSAPSVVQSFTANKPSEAGIIAAKLGVVLWPGQQPTGANGQAVLGDNWDIQTLYYIPTGTSFQSPTVEMLRFFDLFDRGFDPDSAIAWLNGHGYPTAAQWYPPPEKAVLGLQFVYLAARNKVVDHGVWDVVLKTE
jgi:hypothetical protein